MTNSLRPALCYTSEFDRKSRRDTDPLRACDQIRDLNPTDGEAVSELVGFAGARCLLSFRLSMNDPPTAVPNCIGLLSPYHCLPLTYRRYRIIRVSAGSFQEPPRPSGF